MNDAEIGGSRRVRSVKYFVNFYDDKIVSTYSPSMKKNQINFSMPSSRTREFHRARKDIRRYKETRWTVESSKAEAESELSNAKKMVKDLSSMIDESSNKAKTQMRDIERLEKWGKGQQGAMVVAKRNENYDVSRLPQAHQLPLGLSLNHTVLVFQGCHNLKNELFKLKLDVASVMKDKSRVEKEIEASNSMMLLCLAIVEVLKKEIEEANEEQVLVELAKIKALKELRKLKDAIEEIDESKELEMKLVVTISDVNRLQNELKTVKEMEKRVQGDWSVKKLEGSFSKGEELEDSVINELKIVTAKVDRLKKKEGKVDSTVQNLNSKILRAKTKLEVVFVVEEKTRSIVRSLSHTLEKLKTKTKEAKQENELISREVTTTKEDIKKIEFDMDLTEERLQGVMQELKVAKASEAHALEKLKTLTKTTMKERALTA
ncbi:hypothetical protein Fmac_001512 [Flemingia macrophylla]|uniref:Uncharacterized protein n=1 Tax=Flemingia macrophylla TaxID=520843 RepID=A0ABD1NHA7_9FABA